MDDLEAEQRPPEESDEEDYSDTSSTSKGSRKAKLPLAEPLFQETHVETGFHKTTRTCLQRIREAMLHHRWEEAAEYMASYPQTLQDTTGGTLQPAAEMIWRMGIEILHHHPNSKMEDYNNIYERTKHSGVKHYLKICLEHAFHLLMHGQIEDAKRQLSTAESWRYGKQSAGQTQRIKLVQAYRSLLDYVIWCDKKSAQCLADDPDADNPEMHIYFRQASVNLKEILKSPGVWDSFILAYIDMLEFYEDHTEALRVLSDYAYDKSFPPNPNAHAYLYQYLKRHDAPERKLMRVLKGLHALVPSHELMQEYCALLLQSERDGDVQKALAVTLDMLDYACWKSDVDVWQRLKTIIQRLKLQNGEWKDIVSKKMASRKDWWPALHFTRSHASQDSEQNTGLVEVKASLITVLCPDQNLSYAAGRVIGGEWTE